MLHDWSMAASGDRWGTPLTRIRAALDDLPGWLSTIDDAALGEPLIAIREVIDRSESAFSDGVRRFDRSGEYKADGSLSVIAWLRWKCKLSGGAAAERVTIARQLEELPQCEKRKDACSRRPRPWTQASSPASPSPSSIASMPKAPLTRPIEPTRA